MAPIETRQKGPSHHTPVRCPITTEAWSGGCQCGGEAAGQLPLHDRHGNVLAYATVDLDLYPALSRWKWSLGDSGYVVRAIKRGDGTQQKLRLHRVIMCCNTGDGLEVDHVNRDKLDNRRANLRFVTHLENMRNVDWANRRPRGQRTGTTA